MGLVKVNRHMNKIKVVKQISNNLYLTDIEGEELGDLVGCEYVMIKNISCEC
jgi:hypothetical protein